VTSFVPIEEHSPTSGSVSPMSCQQPVTDVLPEGTRTEYLEGLAVAGFVDVAVRFTHRAADGMHSAIIQATKPTPAF